MKKILVCLLAVFSLSLACFAADFDGYIVKIVDDTAANLSAGSSMFSGASLLEEIDDSTMVKLLAEELYDVKEISSKHMLVKANDEAALQTLIDLGIVESYEKDFYLELLGYDATLNTNYSDQLWYLDYINADFAWNAGIHGNDVTVAVIDSGVYAHSDIENNLLTGKNYVNVENLGTENTADNSDHGTRVAGIIASECNSIATVGVSFKTKILPLKVTDSNEVLISNAVAAINDAVDIYKCDVINLSFGSETQSTSLKSAIDHAINNNVIVVAAAGNSGNSTNPLIYPAAYENVVSVANAEKIGSSLFIRETSQRNIMVDIAAPGTGLHAITSSGSVSNSKSGTSFSCPVISSVAALAKSVKPNISQREFEELIKASADSSYLATSGQDSSAWGAGLVDIKTFIKYLFGEKEYYISDTVTVNNESFVYITNLSDTDSMEQFKVVLSEYDSDGYLEKVEYLDYSLEPASSLEISLSDYGFTSSASVRLICDRLPGDVNNDGTVSIRDASTILRYLSGFTVDGDVSMMDVNGDGEVSIRDASTILRYCSGHNVELH